MDIEGIEALEEALRNFSGTVLMVSHDRSFIKRVCDRVFELKDGRLQELNAGVAALDDVDEEIAPATLARQKAEAATATETLSYEERKKQRSDAGKLQTQIKKLEAGIAQHEEALQKLDALFADGNALQSLSPEDIRTKSTERERLQKELDTLMAEWSALA